MAVDIIIDIDRWHRHRAADGINPFMNIIISVRYCARRKTGPLQNWWLRPCTLTLGNLLLYIPTSENGLSDVGYVQ